MSSKNRSISKLSPLRSVLLALVLILSVVTSSAMGLFSSTDSVSAAPTSKASCEQLGDTWVTNAQSAPYCQGRASCASTGGIWNPDTRGCTTYGNANLSSKMASMSAADRAKSFALYSALNVCIDDYLKQDNVYADIDYDGLRTNPLNGEWYGDGPSSPDDRWEGWARKIAKVDVMGAEVGCSKVTSDALALWDIGTAADLLKAMNYSYDSAADSPHWQYNGDRNGRNKTAQFKAWVEGKGISTSPNGATNYFLNKAAFGSYCKPSSLGLYSEQSSSRKSKIDSYQPTSGVTPAQAKVVEVNGSSLVANAYEHQFGPQNGATYNNAWTIYEDGDSYNENAMKTCSDITKAISSNAGAYLNGVLEDACRALGVTAANDLKACKAGAQFKNSVEYCQLVFAEAAQKAACEKGQGVAVSVEAPPGSDADPDSATEDATSCAIEGLGWVVCPVINFLAGMADGMFGFLADTFLRTDPEAFRTNGPAYETWVIVRNIANVLFVIAFLFIIFSQLTGAGISNYGVKKMLPRLVIAVILVNVSFFVSQIAVDLSNILGYSIRDVFDIVSTQVRGDTYNDLSSAAAVGSPFTDIAVGILAFAGAAVALYALISTFGAIILAVVLALLMILFILIARQAIVIMLVIISPIAFVALLLPNTEKFFTFWRKMLIAMLLLFPIIALVFGGSTLASTVLQGSFTGAYNGEGSNFFGQIVASAVLILPLFAVPILLKKSLDGIPVLGKMANKFAGKSYGNVAKKGRESYGESRFAASKNFRKQKRATNRVLARGGEYEGNNPFLKGRSAISEKLNKSPISGQFGDRLTAQAIGLSNKEEAESISFAEQKIRRDSIKDAGAAQTALTTAIKKGDSVAAKAAQNVLFTQGAGGIAKFYAATEGSSGSNDPSTQKVMGALRENINEKHGQYIKSKAADITSWAATGGQMGSSHFGALSGMSAAELAGQSSHTMERAKASISQATARELLDNKQLNGGLDKAQRSILESVAGPKSKAEATATTTTTGTATAAAGGAPAAATATSASAGSAPSASAPSAGDTSAAQRARDTQRAAAEGTSGSTVFAADSNGVVEGVLPIPHSGTSAPAAQQPARQSTPPANTAAGRSDSHTDSAGRQTPSGTVDPDEYHRRFGGG